MTNNQGVQPKAASVKLTTDQIDEAITKLVLAGPHGPEAGVSLARIAGRAVKFLCDVVGPEAAMATTNTLRERIKSGSLQ